MNKEAIMRIIRETFQCRFGSLFINVKHGTKTQQRKEEEFYNKVSEKLDKLSERKTPNENTPINTLCEVWNANTKPKKPDIRRFAGMFKGCKMFYGITCSPAAWYPWDNAEIIEEK